MKPTRYNLKFSGILFSLFASFTHVHAADGAKFRALGFSNDAAFFAFEQYGVQDGSGFSYAHVFVLDIKNDTWVKGTPVTELLEDESGDTSAIRKKAKQSAASAMKMAGIDTDAELLAANPFSEVVANRRLINFHDHYNLSSGIFGNPDEQGSWDLLISTVPATPKADCFGDVEVVGYKLELKNRKSGVTTALHVDKDIPKSRFCPVAYDLEAIVQPVGGSKNGQLVAIIGVYIRGFEGADRRFIALPFKFN